MSIAYYFILLRYFHISLGKIKKCITILFRLLIKVKCMDI